ncbi:hypothetical protein PHISCL_09458 [Aspergillus sclerotialis]|uniref:Magnesium transporter n=1 Tax=Aspergillus sclerotialis TaxID=2070753 RepID=A0A3A2Z5W0_9EURO|nr:hypothetical protein PHISCL_09458 [Aspergillus sclerotialis]
MLPSSPLRPSVPSVSLLRFLRSQSNSVSSLTQSTCVRSSGGRTYRRPSLRRNGSSWTDADYTPCRVTPTSDMFVKPTLSPNGSGSRRRPTSGLNTHAKLYLPSGCVPSRNSSSSSRPLLRRLFDLRKKKSAESKLSRSPQAPALLDEKTEPNFSIARGLAAKASNELRLRCTEFDSNGDVTLVNGEFKKSELIAKYGLLPRDLRKVDSSTLPHILVRQSAILINLLHLRVLIKADRVLVFDAYGSTDSYMQSLFVYDLEGKLRQSQNTGSLPYEFRALEAVLISVTTGLEEEFNGVREPVVRVLRALEEDIDRDKLRHLLIYSKRLGTFEQKARLVRDAIDDLLEADDDLAAMYLTERANGVQREENDHQEVEMLLESYHKVCDEIVQASSNLVNGIRNTEEVPQIQHRNISLATGTLFAGLYGMNLKNFIEESDFGFGGVSVTCFGITAIVCFYGLAKLRKLQRVRMWGESGVGGDPLAPFPMRSGALAGHRSNWRADSIEPVWGGLPGEGRSERMKRLRDGAAAAAAKSAASDATAQRAQTLKNARPASAAGKDPSLKTF